MAASKKRPRVTTGMGCIQGHQFTLAKNTPLRLQYEKATGLVMGVIARCPECGGSSPASFEKIALVYGLSDGSPALEEKKRIERERVIGLFKGVPQGQWRTGDVVDLEDSVIETPPSSETPPPEEEKKTPEIPEDDEVDQDRKNGTVGEKDVLEMGMSQGGSVTLPPGKAVVNVLAFAKKSQKPVKREESVKMEEEQTEKPKEPGMLDYVPPTAQEVLLDIIMDPSSKLDPDKVDIIAEYVKLEPEWKTPNEVQVMLETYGVPAARAIQVASTFRARMMLNEKKMEKQKNMAQYMARGLAQPVTHGGGVLPRGVVGSADRGGQTDPCTLAVQAIIDAAGGVVTPELLERIDAVKLAFASAGIMRGDLQSVSVPGYPSSIGPVSPFSIQQMIQQNNAQVLDSVQKLLVSTTQKEKDEEVARKKEEELNKKIADLQNLVVMVGAVKQAAAPLAPVESETKQMFDMVLGLLKERNVAPLTESSEKKLQNDMFMKMFDLVLESSRGKPNEAVQALAQGLAELKEEIGRRAGGAFSDLPTNPEQLHGIIDYMKVMHDIEKTKGDYVEKAKTRELISTVAQSGFGAIGEAIATAFIQSPGTPQEKQVVVKEQPIDDGTVVRINCPSCGVPMVVPKDAAMIRCPKCEVIMDRVNDRILTPEEAAELQKQAEAEAKAQQPQAGPESVATGSQPATPGPAVPESQAKSPQPSPGGQPAPDELGPVSSQIKVSKRPEQPVPTPEPVQSAPDAGAGTESNINQTVEPEKQG